MLSNIADYEVESVKLLPIGETDIILPAQRAALYQAAIASSDIDTETKEDQLSAPLTQALRIRIELRGGNTVDVGHVEMGSEFYAGAKVIDYTRFQSEKLQLLVLEDMKSRGYRLNQGFWKNDSR